MDIEMLIEAVKLCGSTPKVDQCKQCAYWSGGDMSKCIPRMTTAAATALSTLQAENEKLRAELEQVKAERDVALDYLREYQKDHHATWYDIGASGAHCSRCHYRAPQQSRYCPHCGAKMGRREKP